MLIPGLLVSVGACGTETKMKSILRSGRDAGYVAPSPAPEMIQQSVNMPTNGAKVELSEVGEIDPQKIVGTLSVACANLVSSETLSR